ncbi:hypothetical protein [Marinicella sp. W31]|uniref:hypothetical protein n=1 Tax=Marinicella sp. W31 TaxID=3023713 RepID=UPI00375679DD
MGKKLRQPLLAFCVCLLAFTSTAEVFCVSNTAELETALTTAGTNFESDEIRMSQGTYHNGISGFSYQSTQTLDLTITGGWASVNGNCIVQNTSPYLSVFDGNLIGPNLSINTAIGGNITINNVSFINGFGSGLARGVGLLIDSQGGTVMIEGNVFTNNRSTFCSAMCLTSRNETTVRNNVFAENNVVTGTGSIHIDNFARGVYFINNTVINNTTSSTLLDAYAGLEIDIRGGWPAFIANNILWNNFNGDVVVREELGFPSIFYLYSNNFLVSRGSYDFIDGNLSEDPLLEGSNFFNYSPSLASQMRNAGRMMPTDNMPGFENGWSHGLFDLIGTARIQDRFVDIGAREATPEAPIFKDGFE